MDGNGCLARDETNVNPQNRESKGPEQEEINTSDALRYYLLASWFRRGIFRDRSPIAIWLLPKYTIKFDASFVLGLGRGCMADRLIARNQSSVRRNPPPAPPLCPAGGTLFHKIRGGKKVWGEEGGRGGKARKKGCYILVCMYPGCREFVRMGKGAGGQ